MSRFSISSFAPKSTKLVKTVKLRVTQEDGTQKDEAVPVYLQTAGDPTFLIYLPAKMVDIFHHLNKDSYHHRTFSCMTVKGVSRISASTFDAAVEGLKQVSRLYKEHLDTKTIEKMIDVYVELSAPSDPEWTGSHHETPEHMRSIDENRCSFSKARYNVGLTADICYRAGGQMYEFDGYYASEEGQGRTEPNDMRDLRSYHPRGVVVPYTDVAWVSILSIQKTLRSAAMLLRSLTKEEEAMALLNSHVNLLTAPEVTKRITRSRRK